MTMQHTDHDFGMTVFALREVADERDRLKAVNAELLAALRLITNADAEAQSMSDYHNHGDFEQMRRAVNEARAAIAKAGQI